MKKIDYAELDLDRLALKDAICLLSECADKYGEDAIIYISEWGSLAYQRDETEEEMTERLRIAEVAESDRKWREEAKTKIERNSAAIRGCLAEWERYREG